MNSEQRHQPFIDGRKMVKQASKARTGNFDACQFLSCVDEFSDISADDLKTLAENSRYATYDSGQYVVTEGAEEGLSGFIVVSGRLAMLKTSGNGKQLIVELLQTGDIFGMLLTLAANKLPAQLSARSIERTAVLWVQINSFMELLKKNPILFSEVAAHLLICLQSSYGLARGLAHDRVYVRIAAVLSSLALKFAKRPALSDPLTIKFTRQQLADLTGTTSETAIRVTRAMQQDGLIEINRPGIIRILNLEALQGIVET